MATMLLLFTSSGSTGTSFVGYILNTALNTTASILAAIGRLDLDTGHLHPS